MIGKLSFLAGAWETAGWELHFSAPRDGTILGTMRAVGKGAEGSFEFHRFAEERGNLVYRPYPRGIANGVYELVPSPTGFVFASPGHPQFERVFFARGTSLDELVCGMDSTCFVFRRASCL